MAVKNYSRKKDGAKALSENFSVREFACNDGSDNVLIDSELVTILQKIRNRFGKPVIITSAYRTPAYNKAIAGSTSSQHCLGKAADCYINGVEPVEIAKYAESIGVTGVGLYTAQRFVHIDTRANKYYWKNTSGNTVSSFGGKNPYRVPMLTKTTPYFCQGTEGEAVRWIQFELNACGAGLKIDGAFGAKTHAAVINFQKKYNLVTDGLVGAKAIKKMRDV